MTTKFGGNPLVVERKSYTTKLVNAYIFYELNSWPKIPLNIFTLQDCLFGATN